MNDLRTILLGDQQWIFLLECAFRATFMIIMILLLFKITGKKEVRQFSVLELIVLIGLGSALGDPMFYDDVGILPALVAITVVLILYRVMNSWTNRAPKVGEWLSGKVVTVFSDGKIDRNALQHEGWSVEEFFGDLRVAHVEHLGQVKAAHVEVDGDLSIFFRPDDDVMFGLPIAPEKLKDPCSAELIPAGPMSCGRCGNTLIGERKHTLCPNCGSHEWLSASNSKRVT